MSAAAWPSTRPCNHVFQHACYLGCERHALDQYIARHAEGGEDSSPMKRVRAGRPILARPWQSTTHSHGRMTCLRRPPVRWSQTADWVRLVVDVPSADAAHARLEGEGARLVVRSEAFEVALDLFAPADAEGLEVRPEPLGTAVTFHKREINRAWPRLTAGPHAAAPATIGIDWSRYDPEPGEDYDDEDVMTVDC